VENTKTQPRRRRIYVRLWRAEVVYTTGLILFAGLALLAHYYAYFEWDLEVSHAVQSVPWIHGFMCALSVLGDGWVPFALTGVSFLLFLIFKLRFEAYGLLLSVAGGEILNRLTKLIVGRPRPTAGLVHILQIENTESFPSGHVTFYVCYFGFLFFTAYARLPRGSFARRAALIVCTLPILLIGLSRIYLGAHWPSDTLGAYLFAGLWLGVAIHFYRSWTLPSA
jgi:membrane-associated phospholipid phosphatase